MIPQVISETMEALQRSAQEHKSAAQYHKRRAREEFEKIRVLREKCEQFGIKFVLEHSPQTKGVGGKKSHGRTIHPNGSVPQG